ncbi:GntR family transcriptional regulator [Roseibium alexandrii]|uniref:Transcriptional regulator n=1 Tax=Roseibium alexandrii (strain DSM 17067 / NCIMB 14079 / DFL-11) TaxID=244592 RepID=A0A5E8H2C9_ROSAD|nr:GntR family transcriptional regulator [Roseibium alexandrii]EEE46560.1 Transcriptional regulator [Roseibium alexandrii DFL-11]
MKEIFDRIVPAPSLTEVTANRIRDAITTGDLPLGHKLSEQRLADMLGVSRSPVHDALAILQSEGLVNISPKRGSYVFTPDLKEVDNICEHRALLETGSVRRAIARNKDKLVAGLQSCVDEMEEALRVNSSTDYTRGDLRFHETIVRASCNRSIASAYKRTISPLIALRTHLFTIMNANIERSLDEHVELLDACKRGDADLAAALLEDHIGHLIEAYRQELSSQTGFEDAITASR